MIKKVIRKYHDLPSAVKAGLWFTVCNFLQKGISFITVPIFTRIMNTEDYGLYSVYSSWYSILTIFATLHLSYYVFNKGMVKYENDRDEFVVSIQSLSAFITLVLIVIYLPIRVYINGLVGMPTSLIICMLVQVFFEPPILYWTARKRFEFKYKAVLLVTLTISIINPALGFLLIGSHVFENAAFARAFSICVVATVAGCLLAYNIIRHSNKAFSRKYWKYALAFNLPLIPHFLSSTILNQADRIMIERMTTKTNAALYSVAYSAAMVCNLFSLALQQAFLPWLYQKMAKEDYEKIPETINAFLLFILSILTVTICFAPELIWVLGSTRYAEAIWVIPPVCGSVFFILLQNLFANIEYYFEKTKAVAVASVGVAVLNVLLNYIFIEKYGYLAAGYTTLICYIVYSITHFLLMRKLCIINKVDISSLFDLKSIIALSIFTICIVFLMVGVYQHIIIRYAIITIIAIIVIIKRKFLIQFIHMLINKTPD